MFFFLFGCGGGCAGKKKRGEWVNGRKGGGRKGVGHSLNPGAYGVVLNAPHRPGYYEDVAHPKNEANKTS